MPFTDSTINAQIDVNLPDNTTRSINALGLRGILKTLTAWLSSNMNTLETYVNSYVSQSLGAAPKIRYLGNYFAQTSYLRVAQLPPDANGGNLSHFVFSVYCLNDWQGENFAKITYMIANRDMTNARWNYKYQVFGGKAGTSLTSTITVNLMAIRRADNQNIDLFLKFKTGYHASTLCVELQSAGVTYFPNEAAQTTVPSGVVVYDSSNLASFPPMIFVDSLGNMKTSGTVTPSATSW